MVLLNLFAGRYTPLSDTLVGALHEKLKLSVKLLARNKEEDLRHAYMCWWSKPLPEHLPYRKLLCFENRCVFSVNRASCEYSLTIEVNHCRSQKLEV